MTPLSQIVHCDPDILGVGEQLPRFAEEPPACRRERQALRGAPDDQLGAERALKPRDSKGHGRRGDMEPLAGGGHRAELGGDHEALDLPQVQHDS